MSEPNGESTSVFASSMTLNGTVIELFISFVVKCLLINRFILHCDLKKS